MIKIAGLSVLLGYVLGCLSVALQAPSVEAILATLLYAPLGFLMLPSAFGGFTGWHLEQHGMLMLLLMVIGLGVLAFVARTRRQRVFSLPAFVICFLASHFAASVVESLSYA